MRIVWENTRLLCELVKKREAVKLKHVRWPWMIVNSIKVEICQEIFGMLVKPAQMALEETIDVLERKDKNQV